MEPIKISVTGALATVTQKPVLTSGTVGLDVEFAFDEAWTSLKKTAVFRCGNRPIPPVLCEENRAQVPWEALERPGCTLFVGVYGTDSEGIDLPTVWAEVDRVREGATVPDVDPSEPTPNAYEQLLAAAKQAAADAESVRQDADNGKFKGDQGEQGPKGDKGDAGVIDFIVVTELPADGDGSKIYLVPNATGENNNFDEYIFQNGLWEKIGSAGVEVNLEEYVKKTDYANANIGGVVKIGSTYNGISIDADGVIGCYGAEKANIDGRNSRKPICPTIMDYAIKVGLTTNKETWEEEEKQAAREQLGVGIATYKTAGLLKPSSWTGIMLSNATDGTIALVDCTQGHIDDKGNAGNRIAITTKLLDYAVKKALTDCKTTTWTDEEKAAARELLGTIEAKTSDRTSVYAVNSRGEQILVGTCQNAANNGMIPLYSSNGNINVSTPISDVQAANKAYVDAQIAALVARVEALEGNK